MLRDPDNPDRLKISSSTCHDRFCVPCADTRSAKMGRRIRDKVADDRISFLTLTLADNDVPLSELMDKLLSSFRKLRQWRFWKSRVAGGVAFLEVKWNEERQRWHPHLHAIIDAAYIEQKALSDRWLKITRTSFIVHIKRPRDAETAIRYVTKYGSKPLDHSFVNNAQRLDEAIDALKGRHLCTVFGDWRGWCLTDDDEHQTWEPIDTLSRLIAREASGDGEAAAILERLRCMTHKATTSCPQNKSPPPTAPS